MTNHLTEPFPGDPISATLFRELIRTVRACRIIGGKNVLLCRGPNGTVVNVDVPRGGKSAAADPLHPWKIFGGKRPESGSQPSKAQRVYVPAESLIVDVLDCPASDIIGLTADGDLDDFYELDCLETLAADTPSIIYLFVYRETEPESEGADPQTYAEVAASLDDSGTYDPGAHEILAAFPLFNITRKEDDEGESVLTVNLQYQHCAIVVAGNGGAVEDSDDKGCFCIVTKKDDEGKAHRTLENLYYMEGNILHQFSDADVPKETVWPGNCIYIRIGLSSYGFDREIDVAQLSELMQLQKSNPSIVYIPIYEFDSNGDVKVDFRKGVHAQVGEDL